MSVYGETPTGTVNGTNHVFTLSQAYFAGSTRVFANGIRKDLGVDYTESSSTQITFVTAPVTSTVLLVDYDIAATGGNGYPLGEWTFGPAGGLAAGAALFNGPLLFPAGINPGETQTAVVVIGPGGAQATVPAVFDGPAGLPPVLSTGTIDTLTPGSSATVAYTLTSPGGAGVASAYTVDYGIPSGMDGTSAANTLISPAPSDLEGTPLDTTIIGYSSADTKAKWIPIPIFAVYNISTTISTTGTSAGDVRSLTSITIPSQTRPYIPIVMADCVITGTVNTRVDLVARIGGSANTTDGVQVARGRGPSGTILGTNAWTNQIVPNFASVTTSDGSASITSGSKQIWLNCEQQASTSDQYSTGLASFTILLAAVPA